MRFIEKRKKVKKIKEKKILGDYFDFENGNQKKKIEKCRLGDRRVYESCEVEKDKQGKHVLMRTHKDLSIHVLCTYLLFLFLSFFSSHDPYTLRSPILHLSISFFFKFPFSKV